VRAYNPMWLRAQICVVSQEPKLLPKTLRQNLCFGCQREPSLAEIEEACRAANIWQLLSDVKKFPKGLETEMGVMDNVSGGEKQRICIARAILADRPILLLDEATSALDEVSQEQVQLALSVLMKGRTTLMVAHRLTTIKTADKIVAMSDGTVDDIGTHDELIARSSGVYKALWERSAATSAATSLVQPIATS